MALNPEALAPLRQLGLNQYEAKAYLALSSFGKHTAGELSERAELPRPRVYDVLKKLQDKGFVLIQNTRPVTYAALPVSEALTTLKRQRHEELNAELAKIEDLAKKLESKIKPTSLPDLDAGETVWTLKGRDAIYSKIGAMIAGAKKRVLIASTEEGFKRKLEAYGRELDKARKRGVKIHFVSKANVPDFAKIAHVVTKTELPSRMVLTDDQALLFLSEHAADADEETGLWMHNPRFSETLHSLATTCG